ncbi:MAG: hypothetical protein WBA68_02060 [Alteraurantiacibacter sp.]
MGADDGAHVRRGKEWVDHILAHPTMRQWEAEAPEEALVASAGECDVNSLLIRGEGGRYRKADGADLARLAEVAPRFIENANRVYEEPL